MKAVIMAGGEGRRLKSITGERPKPMVPLLGRPMMEHILLLLKKHGFDEVCAAVKYRAEDIMRYFGDGSALGVRLEYRVEREALGTAALNGVPAGGTVLLLDSLPGDNGIRQRLEAAKAVLEREGRQVRICRWTCGSTSFGDILRIARPSAVIAFEAAALSDMAELSKGEPAFPLLYGCGSTAGIAAALEKSRVTAITAVNVFSAGYLAVEAGAKLARHENWTVVSTVGFSIVRKETMYDSDNQKLLFPVT